MLVATIRLSHPDLTMARTFERVPNVRVHPEHQTMIDDGFVHSYATVCCADLARFDAALAEDPTVLDWSRHGCDGDPVYALELSTDRLRFGPVFVDIGLQVLDLVGGDGGWTFRLRTPDRGSLACLRRYCDEEGVSFELRSLTDIGEESALGLTVEQREALRVAYEMGYFEEPRAVSLAELGERLGVSATAAGRRLRRATAAFIEHSLVDDV
ncbi:helix-turn-helix domain-containing protein [Halomarina rubra]|uniref:Helix-turn-helix domain-containing protein n=1 Tax=Halomarina rubra TaxID=2071873 RepID=A0ABD6AQS5_9EURY|nr:helix-turn-helix domain-containing protein [Halomarina rubra]